MLFKYRFRTITILILSAVCSSLIAFSQTTIKFKKQPTAYFYAQTNLHGGIVYDKDGLNFSLANTAIRNRITMQGFFRSGKTLQRGYISKVGVRTACAQISLDFDPNYYGTNGYGALQLRLMDNWIGFGTKKSRRNFWLGNKRVEYGRNPRLDAEANFMNRNSLQIRDFGFWWDLGWFYRSPLIKNPNNRWDIILQLSSGGWLFNGAGSQGTILFTGVNREHDSLHYMNVGLGDLKYRNTFLAIIHIGQPTYKPKEFSVFVIGGHIRDQSNLQGTVGVVRLGLEYIIKHKEKLKFGTQISFGPSYHFDSTYHSDGREEIVALMNNSLDYSFDRHWAVALSQYIGSFTSLNPENDGFVNYSIIGSLSYIFNPDIKLRINAFYDNGNQWINGYRSGTFLQFIAGFGRRP
jgi:hypothetical protein